MELNIASLAEGGHGEICLPCRVLKPRYHATHGGRSGLRMRLADFSGDILAVAWSDQLPHLALNDGDTLLAGLAPVQRANRQWFEILNARALPMDEAGPRLIPRRLASRPEDLKQLAALTQALNVHPLRSFVISVSSCPEIYTPFVQVPASRAHHHDFPGGLLCHSLESAGYLQRMDGLHPAERDLAITGALFHDIGKIRTLTASARRTRLGHVVDHSQLTLEVLASHLARLDRYWPVGAIALRQAWQGRPPRGRYPQSRLRLLVQTADQLSASGARYQQAFRGLPAWRGHVVEGDEHLWRPQLPCNR